MKDWFVYIVRCKDGSLYTGITTELERRINEHNNSSRSAAAYTRSRRPVVLVYHETCGSRSEAARKEAELRRLDKKEKENLIRISGCARGTSIQFSSTIKKSG